MHFATRLLLFSFWIISWVADAVTYSLPAKGSRLLGSEVNHQVKGGEYFQQLAKHYNVGFLAMMAANPKVDPFLPPDNTILTIPTQLLLPYVEHKGIVINLPELRLYYFHPNEEKVTVFPVGLGQYDLPTPSTTSYISEKTLNPIWRPTKAMRVRYFQRHGIEMAKEILPGPKNPFGKYALRLGTSEYLIHGTNQRFGIGMRSSSGCLRLYDADIKWLFDNVPLNTQVKIIDQPIKMSYEANGQRLIEFHQPLTDKDGKSKPINKTEILNTFVGARPDRWRAIESEITNPKGLVVTLIP